LLTDGGELDFGLLVRDKNILDEVSSRDLNDFHAGLLASERGLVLAA
jgi:hypothetical protein